MKIDRLGSPGLPIFTLGALAFGGLSAWWSLHEGDKAVLQSATARPADLNDPKERALDNVVEEMAIAAGLPKPRVFVIPDADPNAFATGPGPEKSSIAVTFLSDVTPARHTSRASELCCVR